MRLPIVILLQLIFMLPFSQAAFAQQQLVRDPAEFEKAHFSKVCEKAEFADDFATPLDINNDGLMDVVINHGAITCDGEKGASCTPEGCPYNFYVQAREGGHIMIATAQIYGYDFIKRFGNMVFVFKMHPKYCERTDERQCEMTVRVRGTRFVTISKN